jgi:homoserine O-acetyltransferase/O-succinyltransferase
MVRVQERFLRECFGIEEVALVTGGSMGGMQALEWAVRFPNKVKRIAPIATCARTGARAMAFNECARKAILLDPAWNRGEYYDDNSGGPHAGLALARMISTITFLTDETMQAMFGRRTAGTVEESALERDIHARFEVQQYLHDEGEKLVQRFDANTYLYMSRAMDLHDVSRGFASLTDALSQIQARALMIGVSGDDLFPVGQTHEVVERLRRVGKTAVTEYVVESSYGHDAFLTEYRKMLPPLREFLQDL